jgi:hypothetical protein
MIVRPMIDGWDVPCIERIEALEHRRITRLPIPGLQGDLVQDLGGHGLRVAIEGSLQGDETRDAFLDTLRGKFRAGQAVPFVADITTASELDQVLVESLQVAEVAGSPDSFRYRIVLQQYVEPPAAPPAVDELGLELGAELDGLAGLGLDALGLPDLLGGIPEIADPVAPMQPALESVRTATAPLDGLLDGLRAAFGVTT